ncbi:MAG: ATP/GTP-binding protein [Candidatus Aenigmatarchaeota archaeon]
MNVIFIGPAGSGKTSLVKAFSEWIKENRKNEVACINLDPGVDYLPYKASFDIRELFTVEKIMKEENLGPNGALVRAIEKLIENKENIKKIIEGIDADFKLVDLPGQLEPFIFHRGYEIVKIFDIKRTLGLFLIPAELLTARGIIIAEFISLATRLRLEIHTINILTKSDLLENKNVEELFKNYSKLRKEIEKEEGGLEKDLIISLAKFTSKVIKEQRIIKTSAKTKEGLDELYDICHEIFCSCGDIS